MNHSPAAAAAARDRMRVHTQLGPTTGVQASKIDGFSVIEMEEAKRAKQKRDHRVSDNSLLGTFLAQTSNFDTWSKICPFV